MFSRAPQRRQGLLGPLMVRLGVEQVDGGVAEPDQRRQLGQLLAASACRDEHAVQHLQNRPADQVERQFLPPVGPLRNPEITRCQDHRRRRVPQHPGGSRAGDDPAARRGDRLLYRRPVGGPVDPDRAPVPGGPVGLEFAEHHARVGDEPLADPVVVTPHQLRANLAQLGRLDPSLANRLRVLEAAAEHEDVGHDFCAAGRQGLAGQPDRAEQVRFVGDCQAGG